MWPMQVRYSTKYLLIHFLVAPPRLTSQPCMKMEEEKEEEEEECDYPS